MSDGAGAGGRSSGGSRERTVDRGDAKRWRAYEPYLLSGLWHVHTDVTDGANDADELLAFAAENRFPLIGFVEHVRRQPTYDFEAFAESVRARAREYDVECVVGCEAKVLNEDGELDVSDRNAELADVVYAAYHGTPFDRESYLDSVRATLENPIVDVWAHPFAYAHREGFELSRAEAVEVLDRAAENDVLVEYNLRYDLPPALSRLCRERARIVGYDLHDVDRWSP